MAPTPASTQGTTGPTAKNFDCTATPRSPFPGSRPTIENVDPGSTSSSGRAASGCARGMPAQPAASAQRGRVTRNSIRIGVMGRGSVDYIIPSGMEIFLDTTGARAILETSKALPPSGSKRLEVSLDLNVGRAEVE